MERSKDYKETSMFRASAIVLLATALLCCTPPQSAKKLATLMESPPRVSPPVAVEDTPRAPSECVLVGREVTPNVGVVVSKDCPKKGVVLVSFCLFGAVDKSMDEGVPLMIKILGHKPVLALFYHTEIADKNRTSKIPCFFFVVTGRAN
jgi:hypothetical protein